MEAIIDSLRLRDKGVDWQKGALSNGGRYVSRLIFEAMCSGLEETLLAIKFYNTVFMMT